MVKGYYLDENGTYTYFITSTDGFVKIGSADDPYRRLSQLQTANPHGLKLELVIKGHKKIERLMHHIFSEYRQNGEWFRNEGILKQFLEYCLNLSLIIEDLYCIAIWDVIS